MCKPRATACAMGSATPLPPSPFSIKPSIYLTVGGSHRPMDGSLRDQIARWF